MTTTTKPKPARKTTRRKTTAKRRATKPRKPAMPDIGRPDEVPGAITGEAYAEGRYELSPQVRPSDPVESPTDAVEASAGGIAPAADDEPSEPPPGGVDANGFPLPPSVIRMVHDDPFATADGIATDESGALLVPLARVDEYKALGYRIEHAT